MKNKREFLETLTGSDKEYIPGFCTSLQEAQEKVQSGAWRRCVQRDILRGHGGAGVSVHSSAESLTEAPLYTEYLPKTDEYRVHVFKGRVLDVQRKARSRDVPDEQVDWEIRNHSNGFIFAREGVLENCPEQVKDVALDCVQEFGLDFGAVDIIWNRTRDKAYVLEINTAPGLEGTTLDLYVQAIKDYQEELCSR